ncbi:sodium- and chloride-dependent glycine transporter 1-like isoform X1 [Portunus trituberculatus]|uniref:sodium- and chloride-dependent glycine transporter 1-like isoform X1 n=2 Tax=Portunus trituberculatus TaxID=210409 RepID=UPI001E1CB6B8|nr:sodium- and chloride-dependent glycine transporter 1-like isoform X1 [Portunus trituberculatus]
MYSAHQSLLTSVPSRFNQDSLPLSHILSYKTGPDMAVDKKVLNISSPVEDKETNNKVERENWKNPLQFIFYCLGYAVGFGNVWRFPYLCYKNGGAAFLIPYVTMLFMAGIPVFFMELSIGQYVSLGPAVLFSKMAPIFSGLGWSMVAIAFFTSIFFNVILAWSFFYLIFSFYPVLPWSHCDNDFNSPECYHEEGAALCRNQSLFFFSQSCLSLEDYCGLADLLPFNETHCSNSANTSLTSTNRVVTKISASEDFFRNRMLLVSGTTWEEMGGMQWELVGLMALSCVIVSACLSRGIRATGNIVYFTAVFPYAVLIILFIRGITLEGAYKGLEFYILKPNMTRLTEVEVWSEAAVQIFFSLGLCYGSLITLSSYSKFTYNCMRDAFVVALANCSTSVCFGVVIFSVLGFLASEMGVEVKEVAASGSGLAFVVYPAAISLMPFPQLWSVLFFLMLITVGFGTQFSMVEAVTTAIVDQFESLRKKKAVVVIGTCICLFLMGLSMCLQGGIYMLELYVFYSPGVAILIICILQVIAVVGIFGFRNVFAALEEMKMNVRLPLRIYWGVTWLCLTPASLLLITVVSFTDIVPASWEEYVFPDTIQVLGWLLCCCPLACVLVGAAYAVATNKEGLLALFKTTPEFCPASQRGKLKEEMNGKFQYSCNNEVFTIQSESP